MDFDWTPLDTIFHDGERSLMGGTAGSRSPARMLVSSIEQLDDLQPGSRIWLTGKFVGPRQIDGRLGLSFRLASGSLGRTRVVTAWVDANSPSIDHLVGSMALPGFRLAARLGTHELLCDLRPVQSALEKHAA